MKNFKELSVENKKRYLIITRHRALVEYLKELGIEGDVLEHATPEDITGRDVIGVLPHSLSCLTNTFTEVPLSLPRELRGKELSLEEVKKYAGEPITYKITKIRG